MERKPYKSIIMRKARAFKLDLQIQGNMPGYWYTLYLTDDVKPGRAGYQIHSGDSVSTLAFLKGWGYCKDYAFPTMPEYPTGGMCPECTCDQQRESFSRGDSCTACGWRPACPLCDTEI